MLMLFCVWNQRVHPKNNILHKKKKKKKKEKENTANKSKNHKLHITCMMLEILEILNIQIQAFWNTWHIVVSLTTW